jgi:hypothetical protein
MIFDSNDRISEILQVDKYHTKLTAGEDLCKAISKFSDMSFDVGEVALEFVYHGRVSAMTYDDTLAVISLYTLKAGSHEPVFFYASGHLSLESALFFICHYYYEIDQFKHNIVYDRSLLSDIGFNILCRSFRSYWNYAENVKYDKYGRLLKTLYSHPDDRVFDANDIRTQMGSIGLREDNEYRIDIIPEKREYYANYK